MSAITAKARRKMKKYAVLTREPRCFLGSFDFSWEQRKFSDITFPAGEKNRDNLPLESYSITNEHGFVPQDEKFENGGTMREADKRMYYIVSPNSFAYNPARINVGSIGYQNIGKNVIVSSLYEVFKTSEDVDDRLLWHWFKSPDFQKLIMQLQEGGVRLYFYYDKLCMGEVSLPSLEEQRKIGKLFDTLDNLITLHQRKCVFLFSFFRACISMNFTASTFSWEQRKVSDLAEKTYGGGTPTTSNEAYWNGDIPWIQSSDVVDGKLLGVEPRKWITQDGLNNSAAQLIPGNSIAIITRVGVGKLAFMPYSYATSQDFLSLSKLNAEPLFTVYACYKKLQSELNAVQGTSIKGITKDELLAKNIMVPRYAEQQQIGAFFKQLDHLITLHQRECISFTGSAGRLILTANKKRTASSWEQRKFGEVFDCTVPNNTLSRVELSYDEGTVLNVHYGDVLIKYGSVLDVQKDDIPRIPHRCIEDFNGALLQDGDVIIADTAEDETTGKACEIGNLQGSAIVSGLHTMVCRPRNRMALGYLGYYLNSNAYHHQLLPLMQGIKVLSLSRSNIQKTSVSYPSAMKEQQLIASYFSQLDHLITLHQRKPFLMKWRTSDANRNQTNRLVL